VIPRPAGTITVPPSVLLKPINASLPIVGTEVQLETLIVLNPQQA
jgi:hypothetical protein